jgi:hypothetical protein
MLEFQIRPKLLTVLSRHAEQLYLERLVSLVSEWAQPNEPPSATRERCRELVRRARARGFATEFEIAIYVACGFAEGMNFEGRDDRPYRRILEDGRLSPRHKAQMMTLLLENAEFDDPAPDEAV